VSVEPLTHQIDGSVTVSDEVRAQALRVLQQRITDPVDQTELALALGLIDA